MLSEKFLEAARKAHGDFDARAKVAGSSLADNIDAERARLLEKYDDPVFVELVLFIFNTQMLNTALRHEAVDDPALLVAKVVGIYVMDMLKAHYKDEAVTKLKEIMDESKLTTTTLLSTARQRFDAQKKGE